MLMSNTYEPYDTYRDFLNDNYFHYLFYSATTFIIPSIYALYLKNLDHCIIFFLTFLTSILRWRYPKNEMYVFIDHSFVKLVFMSSIIYIYYSFNERNKFYMYMMMAMLSSVFLFYVLGCIAFYYENDINIPLHMIVHIYSMTSWILATSIYKSFLRIK